MPTAQITTIALTFISVALLVGGFLCPPMGVIDGSVLAAAGILFAFAALWVTAHAVIEKGASAEIKRGDTEIKIETENDDEN